MSEPSITPGPSVPATGTDPAEARLSQIYKAHWHEICRYVAATFGKGPPDPEDVAQLAFSRLAAHSDLSEIRNPRAFLHTAARNIVLSEKRSQTVRERHARETSTAAGAGGDDITPERVLQAKEQFAVVYRTLEAMPAKRRRILILARVDGLSFAEIARRTGLSPTAVKKHAARAMVDLDAALAKTE